MSYARLFSNPPKMNTLGDLHLWDLMGLQLSGRQIPSSQTALMEDLAQAFQTVSGHSLEAASEHVRLRDTPDEDDPASAPFWREKAFPLLLERSQDDAGHAEEDPSALYHPAIHRFRFAAWAASTAARSSKKCRFSVETGAALLQQVRGLYRLALGPHWLPQSDHFDAAHRTWCEALITAARDTPGVNGAFTFGVAAKLVNCYTKALFLSGQGFENSPFSDRIRAIHPPVDRVLLDTLAKGNVGERKTLWRSLRDTGWSNFDQADYDRAMHAIKDVTGQKPWLVEAWWQGFQ